MTICKIPRNCHFRVLFAFYAFVFLAVKADLRAGEFLFQLHVEDPVESMSLSFQAGLRVNDDNAERDINYFAELTLSELFYGRELDVIVDRRRINRDCKFSRCPYCNNANVLKRSVQHSLGKGSTVSRELVSPCPYCKGVGVLPDSACPLYYTEDVRVQLSIPRGSKPGMSFRKVGFGNEVLDPSNSSLVASGDVIFTIDQFSSGNFTIHDDMLTTMVNVSASQLLNGFEEEIPFLDGKSILVNRTGRTTLPDSSIVISRAGLPSPEAEGTPGDLKIVFGFAEIVQSVRASIDRNGNLAFASQEDLNDYMRKSEMLERDKMSRGILMLLKRSQGSRN